MIAVEGEARPIWGLAEGRRGLVRLVESLAEHLGLGGRDVGVRLVDDAEMAEMNLAYRGLPGPTNVLSFPESEAEAADVEEWAGDAEAWAEDEVRAGEEGEETSPADVSEVPALPDAPCAPPCAAAEAADELPALGDIILDLDAVARESRLYGQPVRTHLVRLLAHALLHLAGYEHGPEMETRTESAVAALGEA